MSSKDGKHVPVCDYLTAVLCFSDLWLGDKYKRDGSHTAELN